MNFTRSPGPPGPGEKFHCEACGHDSIAKQENVMEGWRCVGKRLVCALCGAAAAPASASDAADDAGTPPASNRALDNLASFLGTDIADSSPKIDLGESDGRFCKNCAHFLRHPFQSRCLRHDRDVEPMEDCADFAAISIPEDSSSAAESRNETDKEGKHELP